MGERKHAMAPIDESVGLLNIMNSDLLDDIRDKNPDYRDILETGVIAGEADISSEELKLRAELCMTTITETLKKSKEQYLPSLSKKLKRLQKIELWSQLIIVISSSAVLVLLLKEAENPGLKWGAYIGASLSTIGALLTVFLKRNSGGWSFNNQNVATAFDKLVSLRIEAEEILRQLNVKVQFIDNNADTIVELIQKCNKINKDIRNIIDRHFM